MMFFSSAGWLAARRIRFFGVPTHHPLGVNSHILSHVTSRSKPTFKHVSGVISSFFFSSFLGHEKTSRRLGKILQFWASLQVPLTNRFASCIRMGMNDLPDIPSPLASHLPDPSPTFVTSGSGFVYTGYIPFAYLTGICYMFVTVVVGDGWWW